MTQIFSDALHEQLGMWPIAYIPYGGADFGEVRSVARAIGDGDESESTYWPVNKASATLKRPSLLASPRMADDTDPEERWARCDPGMTEGMASRRLWPELCRTTGTAPATKGWPDTSSTGGCEAE